MYRLWYFFKWMEYNLNLSLLWCTLLRNVTVRTCPDHASPGGGSCSFSWVAACRSLRMASA
jgi:hypothetical protein